MKGFLCEVFKRPRLEPWFSRGESRHYADSWSSGVNCPGFQERCCVWAWVKGRQEREQDLSWQSQIR
jgi:hypothetical protein